MRAPESDENKNLIEIVSASIHNLNNALAALRGFTEFLEEDLPEGSPEKSFAKKTLQAALEAQAELNHLHSALEKFKE